MKKRLRRGISIIEVTFSIGVVIIGVLGVVTLMPLAHRQAERGVSLDRASSAATQAVEEFRVRGLAFLPNWRTVSPFIPQSDINPLLVQQNAIPQIVQIRTGVVLGQQVFEHYAFNNGGANSNFAANQWFPARLLFPNQAAQFVFSAGTGFCIDGRFMSLPGNHRTSVDPQGAFGYGRFFPYTPEQPGFDPANPTIRVRLHRIGLRAFPAVAPAIMSLLQADELFVARDDVAFRRPTDRTLPPVQIGYDPGPDDRWGVSGVDDDSNGFVDDNSEAGWVGSDDQVYQRQYTGGFSWMATLTPKLETLGGIRDLYTLNVVVFQNRDVNMWSRGIDEAWGVVDVDDDQSGRIDDIQDAGMQGSDDLISPVNERVANIVFNGGEEVTLFTRPGRPQTDLDVKPGQWFMVGATVHGATVTPQHLSHVAKWYRVINVNKPEIDPNTNLFIRRLTVSGPDWNPQHAKIFYHAILMPNVVNVHQKTIRFETSSLWTND